MQDQAIFPRTWVPTRSPDRIGAKQDEDIQSRDDESLHGEAATTVELSQNKGGPEQEGQIMTGIGYSGMCFLPLDSEKYRRSTSDTHTPYYLGSQVFLVFVWVRHFPSWWHVGAYRPLLQNV
jgi:hypothetical protein